jgi:hypothetical protein
MINMNRYINYAKNFVKTIDEDNDTNFSRTLTKSQFQRIVDSFEHAVTKDGFKSVDSVTLRRVKKVWGETYPNLIEVLAIGEDTEQKVVLARYPSLRTANKVIDEVF